MADGSRAAGIAATWQNPAGVNIDVLTTVDVNQDTYPADAAAQITAKIRAYVDDDLNIGDDVIFAKMYEVIYNDFDWVIDITALTINAAGINIVITTLQEAVSNTVTPTINPIAPP